MASFRITIEDMQHPNGVPGIRIAAGAADHNKDAPPTDAIKTGYMLLKVIKQWGEQIGGIKDVKPGSLGLIDERAPSLHERSKPRTPMRRAPKGHR